MMRDGTYRRNLCRDNHGLRLLLAVLLAISPLLTMAQGGGPAPVEGIEAAVPVPCHPGPGSGQAIPEAALSPADNCPHCKGDAPASQCHCCGYAAPAGLSALFDTPTAVPDSGPPRRAPAPDALPESPRDGLFRPPISLS